MNILEKEIEDLIWYGLNTDPDAMRQRGLYVPHYFRYIRQMDLGSYGRADIVGFKINRKVDGERKIYFHVIEIKKDTVDNETFLQSLRYCNALRRIVEHSLTNTICEFRIDLIGKSITSNCNFVYAASVFQHVNLITYAFDFYKGVRFETHNDYSLVNESLPDIYKLMPLVRDQIASRLEREKELVF